MFSNIGTFQQTSSVLRKLNWVMILVAFSFTIELVGLFLSSNILIDKFSAIHISNRLFDVTSTVSESVAGAAAMINKAQVDRVHLDDLLHIYQVNYDQAMSGVESALEMSRNDKPISAELNVLKGKLEIFNHSSVTVLNRKMQNPQYYLTDVDQLIAQEYKLEIDELIRKIQLLVKSRGTNAFENIYRLRYLPLLVAGLITILCVSFTVLTAGLVIRRLRKSVENLMNATKVVAAGDLAFQAEIIDHDELGWFTFAFNQMIKRVGQLYQEAQYAVQIRDDFLSIASHELRTPITPLKLQIQSILRLVQNGKLSTLSPDQIIKMVSIADIQINRLTRLTDDLLDVTRITGGKIELKKERVDISKVIREMIGRYRSEFYANCEVNMNLQPNLFAEVDLSRLEQVLTNLLSNAMKYGEGKPVEVITLRVDPHHIELSVTDHGQGIAPADQERIFGRFERAASSSNFGGLGLGLYIVKQIVLQHSGTVRVESELGQGASFVIGLPSEETHVG